MLTMSVIFQVLSLNLKHLYLVPYFSKILIVKVTLFGASVRVAAVTLHVLGALGGVVGVGYGIYKLYGHITKSSPEAAANLHNRISRMTEGTDKVVNEVLSVEHSTVMVGEQVDKLCAEINQLIEKYEKCKSSSDAKSKRIKQLEELVESQEELINLMRTCT